MIMKMRLEKIEEYMKRGIAEGSCVLITGQTSDSFVYNGHLNPLTDGIRQFSAERNMPIIKYSLDRQIEDLSVPTSKVKLKYQPSIDEGTPATIVIDKVFESLQKSGQPTTVIIDFAEAILSDTTTPTLDESRVLQQILNRVLEASFRVQKHLIIMISRVRSVNSAFAQMPGIIACNIALPEQVEREAAVEIMLKSQKSPLYLGDMTPSRLGRISGGLGIDTLSRLRRTTSQNNPLTRNTVLNRKKELIRKQSGGTLTIHDEERDINEDIAGLAQVKLFIKNTQSDKQNIRALLLGPPGTGKTLCATAVAKAMDTIPISLAQVKSMWVGESERQFRQVIEIIERNAPVTLILDECDQLSMGSRSGSNMAQDSSSVDTSLRGMLMEWLGDIGSTNSGISIIAMSNNANGVDPAFRDRLTTIPILEAITAADKARIAMIQLKRMGHQGDEAGIKQAFAESQKIFTGRQIVKMLAKATRCADKDSGVVSYEAMRDAISGMLRNFGPAEELMSLRAIKFTDEREYLPWVAARLLGDGSAEAPEYMKSFLSSDQTEIDQERLDAQIADLVSRGY